MEHRNHSMKSDEKKVLRPLIEASEDLISEILWIVIQKEGKYFSRQAALGKALLDYRESNKSFISASNEN